MPQNQVDSRWFQQRLMDQRMSQRAMAKLMGLDPGAVSLMLRGKRGMSAAEAAEIARLLDVAVDEVLLRAGIHGQGAKRGKVSVENAPPAGVKDDWQAEFMRKWLDLGLMLMRNRGL